MKNSRITAVMLSSLVFMLFSCSDDTEIQTETEQEITTVSFAAVLNDLFADQGNTKQQQGNLPECAEAPPAFVDVVLTQEGTPVAGTFQEPLRLLVSQDAQGNYFTLESTELELPRGIYTLEYFSVLDENEQVIWLAPAGGNFAELVNSPLPLDIDLRGRTKRYIDVDVLCFDDRQVNEYGYLFFDLELHRAIELCIFGNFCDEYGKHAEAVLFSVSLWNYSGNAEDPKGEILYEDSENVIVVEDDFENGISTTYAVPVCLTLPDTPGLDQYYLEITLFDGLGYEAPGAPVIRSGVMTDEDIRSLFEGENRLDFYHFREGNCNLEDSPNLLDDITG